MKQTTRHFAHEPPPTGAATSPHQQSDARERTRGFRTALSGHLRHRVRQLAAPRAWLLAVIHAAVFAGVYWLTYALRFDAPLPQNVQYLFQHSLPWVVGAQVAVFFALGQFQGWWRYVTFADLVALLHAAVTATLVLAATTFFNTALHIPRSVLILDGILTIVALGALRAGWRIFREAAWPMFDGTEHREAILVGADLANGILAHQIQASHHLSYRVRGFVTTDDATSGARLGQIPILGKLEDIAEIAAAHQVADVLVVAGTLAGKRLRALMQACQAHALNLRIIRSLEDRFDGDEHIPLRDIEINDLLGRDPITLDNQNIGKLLNGRRVMVTGAGGSIGAEICRQILKFNPACVILVGRGENRIFTIERELRATYAGAVLHPCIADIANRERMTQVFQTYQPEVVFHAAAHKHVPLMEANVSEAVRNNVFGTRCVADLAHACGVIRFVMVSSDKAVNPSSVMGATKQLAERYVHALSQESATRFTVVRFGNVLGSAGSVVPIFQEQIRRGGPITVTDPRMTRFFMTIPEASQLVLQAATMGSGGEIFVLAMGEPVRIVDLAHDLIRLSGLPENAVEITFTGIRPGEKLYEELYFNEEQTLPTTHPKVRAAYHRPYGLADVRHTLSELDLLLHDSEDVLRQKLHEAVPEFVPPHYSPANPCTVAAPRDAEIVA